MFFFLIRFRIFFDGVNVSNSIDMPLMIISILTILNIVYDQSQSDVVRLPKTLRKSLQKAFKILFCHSLVHKKTRYVFVCLV